MNTSSFLVLIRPRSHERYFAAADIWSIASKISCAGRWTRVTSAKQFASTWMRCGGSCLGFCVAASDPAGFDSREVQVSCAVFQNPQTSCGEGVWHFRTVSRRPPRLESGTPTSVRPSERDHPARNRTSASRSWSGRKHLAATPPPFAVVSSVHRFRPQPSRRSEDHVGTGAPVSRFDGPSPRPGKSPSSCGDDSEVSPVGVCTRGAFLSLASSTRYDPGLS